MLFEDKKPAYAQDPSWVLDLHHFSVSKALGCVFLFLTTVKKEKVLIITGKGKHSPGGIPKIKPAVEKLLKRMGYYFEEAPSELGGNGALLVFLNEVSSAKWCLGM